MDAADTARLPRYLGAAFLAVFATSLASGLAATRVLTGGISEVFVNITASLARVRASNILQLLTSVGIIVLASLLYLMLRDQSRPMALVAYGWWLAEAVMLAASALGTYGLIALAAEPGTATAQTVGRVFLGLQQNAYTIHMLFFCLGGILWYWLLFKSTRRPEVAFALGPRWCRAPSRQHPAHAVGPQPRSRRPARLPYAPFELVIGLWLLVRGGRDVPAARQPGGT